MTTVQTRQVSKTLMSYTDKLKVSAVPALSMNLSGYLVSGLQKVHLNSLTRHILVFQQEDHQYHETFLGCQFKSCHNIWLPNTNSCPSQSKRLRMVHIGNEILPNGSRTCNGPRFMWLFGMDPFLTIKSPNKYIIYPVTLINQEGLFKTSLSYRLLTWPLTFPGFCFISVLLWSSFHPSPLPTIPLTTPTERYTQHLPLSNVFLYTWLSPGSCLQWV